MSDPRALTVAEALGEIELGNLSAAEWFSAYHETPDELGAYLWRPQGLEDAPGGSGPRTPEALAGVPVAIKDIFCIEGLPATAGSRILESYVPPYTATAVERLLESGARVLGKTNMDEFAMGSSNENSAFGEYATPGIGVACRAARRAAPRPSSPAGSRPARSAPTPAGRSASRRRSAGSSG